MPAGGAGATPRFQESGALGEGAFYVERAADRDLYERLAANEHCQMLTARQVGKSSLRNRTIARLRAEGVRCVVLDLQGSGAQPGVDAGTWFFGLAELIAGQTAVKVDPMEHWAAHEGVPPQLKLRGFLKDSLLAGHDDRVAIFVDEVDLTRRLAVETRLAFFDLLRETFTSRGADAAWARLSWCVIGVATPEELVENFGQSFFQHARQIDLLDLTREETDAFAPALGDLGGDPGAILDEVFDWVHGHPAFTQRILAAMTREGYRPEREAERVERVVRSVLMGKGQREDLVLTDMRSLFGDGPQARWTALRTRILTLYRRVLDETAADGEDELEVHADDVNDGVLQALKVAGLIAWRYEGGAVLIRTRNRLFAEVFGRTWVDGLLADRPLTEDLKRWKEEGRSDALVLRGSRLEKALEWSDGRTDLSWDERALINASLRVARAERAREAARNRVAAVSIGVALLLGLLGITWQWDVARRERAIAQQERVRAEAATSVARAHEALALADSPGGRQRAMILGAAVASTVGQWGIEFSATLRRILAAAYEDRHRLVFARSSAPDAVASVAYAAEGARALVLRKPPARSDVLDVRTGARVGSLALESMDVHSAALSPDGARALTGHDGGVLRLWDTRSGAAIATLGGHSGFVAAAAFSPDGARALTGDDAGVAMLWDVRAGASLAALTGHAGAVRAVALSADGARALTCDDRGVARVWDAGSRAVLRQLESRVGGVSSAALSPDGRRVLTGHETGIALIWDAQTGEVVAALHGHSGVVHATAFSADGARVLTGAVDDAAQLWDARTGAALARLTGHRGAVWAAAFAPDGTRAATGAADEAVRLWDTRVLAPPAPGPAVARSALVAGDAGAALDVDGGAVRVLDVDSGAVVATLPRYRGRPLDARLLADGARVVTVDDDGTARLWNARTGEALAALPRGGAAAELRRASIAPDGSRVVAEDRAGASRAWDLAFLYDPLRPFCDDLAWLEPRVRDRAFLAAERLDQITWDAYAACGFPVPAARPRDDSPEHLLVRPSNAAPAQQPALAPVPSLSAPDRAPARRDDAAPAPTLRPLRPAPPRVNR